MEASVKERLPCSFCCRTGDESLGSGIGKQRLRNYVGNLPSFLAGMACGLPGNACWGSGPMKQMCGEKEVRKRLTVGST